MQHHGSHYLLEFWRAVPHDEFPNLKEFAYKFLCRFGSTNLLDEVTNLLGFYFSENSPSSHSLDLDCIEQVIKLSLSTITPLTFGGEKVLLPDGFL